LHKGAKIAVIMPETLEHEAHKEITKDRKENTVANLK